MDRRHRQGREAIANPRQHGPLHALGPHRLARARQSLYVTEGTGLVQSRGGDIVKIRAGTLSTPPDEWHWHGAAPDHFMAHLSMTEGIPENQGPETEWGDHMTDDQYRGH